LGDALRAYWRAYDGVTYLRAAFTRDLMRGFTLTLVGDNLLDYQVGEPDNLTVLPGRTISLGVRAAF
jgi:iron complex outermembrane receptor protein